VAVHLSRLLTGGKQRHCVGERC